MTAPPEVSVILPYRRAGGTLAEALQSVLEQTDVGLELCCVDDSDASDPRDQDEGPALVAEAAGRDPRVVRLRSGGAGIVAALRVGLEGSRAPFVARMDADDLMLPSRLHRQLEALRDDPRLAVIGTRVEAFNDSTEEGLGAGLLRYLHWQNGILTPEEHARELFVEAPLCHPSVMLRRTAIDAVGGYRDVAWAEDYDLWLRLDAAGFRMAKLPCVLLRWRHRSGRLTFSDPRYGKDRFTLAKGAFLTPKLVASGRPVIVWGAGPTGKRLARAMETQGLSPAGFVDIDPRKIGRLARGVEIAGPQSLPAPGRPGSVFVVVAVGALGARALIRAALGEKGFVEGRDFLCAA